MSVEIDRWLGTYDMNHDGWKGTLVIEDTKLDCITPGCSYGLYYYDAEGKKFMGEIVSVDKETQHMEFNIKFPDNKQPFYAYIFSWDTNKMAGTTIWNKRNFGFYAIKK